MDRRALSRLSRGTDGAVRLAQRDFARFWRGLDLSNPVECRQALLDFLPDLVATYGNVAAVAAVEWWEEQRAKTPGLPAYTPTISDGVPVAQVQASTRAIVGPLWSGEPDAVARKLASATQMWVKYASRDTIARNVAFDPAKPRYARVPRGAKTCAFCAMLASRGWVYLSEKSAGVKGSGNEFHHDCDCEIVPSWDRKKAHIDGYDPDAMYDRYQRAREAVMNMGEDPNDPHTLLAVMRRLHPEAYKDGVGKGSTRTKHITIDPRRKNASHESETLPPSRARLVETLKSAGVEYREVAPLATELTPDEIIAKLGGPDKTRGSCSSLAFAYAANRAGFDVTDFRGGQSLNFFATRGIIQDIITDDSIQSFAATGKDEVRSAIDVLRNVQAGKEYSLVAGEHAAIVRKSSDGVIQYLELQDATNGWKPLTVSELRRRFHCQKSRRRFGVDVAAPSNLTEVESLGKSAGFRELMGYLNTATEHQMKGVGGGQK